MRRSLESRRITKVQVFDDYFYAGDALMHYADLELPHAFSSETKDWAGFYAAIVEYDDDFGAFFACAVSNAGNYLHTPYIRLDEPNDVVTTIVSGDVNRVLMTIGTTAIDHLPGLSSFLNRF